MSSPRQMGRVFLAAAAAGLVLVVAAAGNAGCHDVLSRGQFNEAYTAILQQWLSA